MSNTRDAFNKRLRLAVREATVLVRGKAQEDHDYTSHSGELEKSVETRFIDNGLTGEAYLDTNIASYASFVHEGTPEHDIFAVNKRSLRWFEGNDAIFAKSVRHPGYKGDPFLYDALKNNKTRIDEIFAKHTGRAVSDIASTIRDRVYTFK